MFLKKNKTDVEKALWLVFFSSIAFWQYWQHIFPISAYVGVNGRFNVLRRSACEQCCMIKQRNQNETERGSEHIIKSSWGCLELYIYLDYIYLNLKHTFHYYKIFQDRQINKVGKKKSHKYCFETYPVRVEGAYIDI